MSKALFTRGLGSIMNCILCGSTSDTHSHIFFAYPFSMGLFREMLTIEHFFIDVTLFQILITIDSLENYLKNLNFMIATVIVYKLWKERHERFHQMKIKDLSVLANKIKIILA